MIQSMKLQFYDLLGTLEGKYLDIDTDMINDFIGQGLRDIVTLVRQYNPNRLHYFGSVDSFTANPYDASDIGRDMVLSVTRDHKINSTTYNRKSRHIPYSFHGSLIDPGNLHFAVKSDPGHYFDEDDGLTLYPVPTTDDKGYIEFINFESPDANTNDSIADITDCHFPDSLTRAALLYAVLQAKIREIGYVRKLGQDEIDDMFGVTVVDSASFTDETQIVITHNLGYAPILTILDSNGKEISTEVIHNVPTYTTITINFLFAQSGSWSIANANVAGGLMAKFEDALPTWSAVTSPTLPTAIVPGDLIALTNAIPTYDDIDFTGITAPTALTGTVGTKPTITSLTKTFADITTTRIYHALNYATDLIYKDQPDSDTLTDDVKTFLAAHDTEEAQVAVGAVGAAVQAGRAEIEAEVAQLRAVSEEITHVIGKLNGEIASYKAEIDGDIGEFRSNIERYIALVKKTVDQYASEGRSDVEKFTAEFNYLVQKFRAEIEADISAYKTEADALLGKYRADVEQEAQRNTIGIQKAASYLQEVDRKLNVVNMYFARSGGFVAEYKELNEEYLRRILSFCGVVPQVERR